MIAKKNEYSLDDRVRVLSDKGDPYKIIEKELGPAVGEYREKWEAAGAGRLKLTYPLHLNLELEYGCNLSCEFCIFNLPVGERNYKAKPGDKIPFKKYCQIIDEGIKEGLCSLALNGYNEPLLQKDIVKYINYAKDAGVLDISLHTNGLLLTKSFSKLLIDSGVTVIMFSIDAATAKTYEKIRRSRDFNKVIDNIMYFLELKNTSGKVLPLTRVSFVENKVNHMELENFISFWRDKIDFFMIQSFHNPFVGKSNYEKIKREYHLSDVPFTVCPQPYRRLTITCDGNVLPCCSSYGLEIIVGNIYRESVCKIWNSRKMNELRLKVNALDQEQPQACKRCKDSIYFEKRKKEK